MLCDFKASTEKVGLGIHPDKTKILSNQDKVKEKEITVDNIQIEILKKKRQCQIPWSEDNVPGSRNGGDQKQTEGSVGSISQISSGIDLKRLPTVPQTSSFQHGHHSYDDLCKWHLDSYAEARTDDQESAKEDASPYYSDKKKI